MHVHHRWAQSMTLIQVAIALAAITLLTRKQVAAVGRVRAARAVGALALAALPLTRRPAQRVYQIPM